MLIDIPDTPVIRMKALTAKTLGTRPSYITDTEVRLAIIGDLELSTWRRESEQARDTEDVNAGKETR